MEQIDNVILDVSSSYEEKVKINLTKEAINVLNNILNLDVIHITHAFVYRYQLENETHKKYYVVFDNDYGNFFDKKDLISLVNKLFNGKNYFNRCIVYNTKTCLPIEIKDIR